MRLGFTVVFLGRMKGILEKFVDCSRSTLFLLFHIQALMSLCFPLNVGSIVFMPPYFRVMCALQLGWPLFSKKLKLFGVSMKYFCGLFGHPIYELLAYSER